MGIDIFQDKTRSIPRGSENVVRVTMTEDELVARKGSMPKADSSKANVEHVPNRGGNSGGQ